MMAGVLVQWATLLTLAIFPVLVWMYARLARAEEPCKHHAATVPAFTPHRRAGLVSTSKKRTGI